MNKKVRLAFVGIGWWSNMLAQATLSNPKIEISACLARSESKRKEFIAKFGGTEKSSYEEILSDKTIDAIILTTPNSLHSVQAIDAAKAGKHIYVEKPMGLNVKECKAMIEAAKETNVVLMVGQNSRRMQRYRKAKELISKGMVGKIILAEANSSGNLGLKLTPDIWRYYNKESPGGPLTTYTVHQTDNLNYLVGPIEKVFAFTSKMGGPAETDDVAAATVQFKSGALGTIGGTFITPDRNYMQIHGTEGVILIDEDGGSISYQKKGTETMIKLPTVDVDKQRLDSLEEEMDEFAISILENKIPETDGNVGLQAVAVIEAMYRSAESGKMINIKDLF